MSQIQVSNLTFTYEGSYDAVFQDVSFQIDTDWKLGLIGRNGRGKTTLLRIILGLEQPDHGTIQGQVRPVSAVFQENRLFEDFSALSNAAVVCPKGARQEAARHLTALGLADSLSLPVRALSGGMKRRVSIARAVLAPGPLLVLDEPFTGLDRTTKAVVLDYLKRYTQGRTLLLVTHDPAERDALAHSTLQMPSQII